MSKSKSYFFKRHPVLPEQRGFITSLISPFNEATQYFFKQVLVSNLYQRPDRGSLNEPASSPIPSLTIRKYARGADWETLRLRGLLEVTNYSRAKHRCREYSLQEGLVDDFMLIGSRLPAKDYARARRVDLFTGKCIRAKKKSKLYDSSGNYEPDLICRAVAVFDQNECLFNLEAVEEHVRELMAEAHRTESQYGTNSPEHRRAKGRYLNDYMCFRAVLDLDTHEVSGGIWQYRPAYWVVSTGRVHQYFGGLQSCSRAMKAAAYGSIKNLNNYDLKDSQLHCLVQELEEAGIEASWFHEYLSTPEAKVVYATEAGISTDCWKRCLIALAMGAHLPKRIEGFEHRNSRILQSLAEEAGGDPQGTAYLLVRFREVVAPMTNQLNKWHRWLLTDYIPKTKKPARGGAFITNRCGKTLNVAALPKGADEWSARSKVAAFILQGQEAAFIHHLTLLGQEYGFRPIANEHDGLVVIGEISSNATEEAMRRSGLQQAEMIKKDFVDSEMQAERAA